MGFLLFVLGIFAVVGGLIYAWHWMIARRSICPKCGHAHHVLQKGPFLYPRFYCPDCRVEW
jgi:transposase-like protein